MRKTATVAQQAPAPTETPALTGAEIAPTGAQTSKVPAIPEELNGFTGLEGIGNETWIIPRIKIVQPTSKEGTAGNLRINLTGDEFEELHVVFVKAVQGRILWDKDNPGNEKAICRSYDFLRPDVSIEVPPSDICARYVMGTNKKQILKPVCPNAQWVDNERPACGEVFNLLGIWLEEMLPFWMTLHGTSIQPVRKFLSAIALRRCPLWQFDTMLFTEEQKGDRGKYYIARFASPKPITKELEAEIVDMVLGLKDADVKRTVEAEEAAMDEAGETNGPPAFDPDDPGPEAPPDWMDEGK
jgi:hypothetical protein